MATSFDFLKAEEELQQQKPAFDFLEAEKSMQAPAPAAQPAQPQQTSFDFIAAEKQLEKPFVPPGKPAVIDVTQGLAPRPAMAPAAVETTEPVIDYSAAATEMMSPPPSVPSYGIEDVVKNKDEFKIVQQFMKERYPNKPLPEDPLELVAEFKRSQAKTDFGLANELTWALNATPEQKVVARQAYGIADKIGGAGLGAELLATIQSPSTYVSGVAGWAVRQAATRAVKSGLKTALTTAAVTGGVEGAAAGATDVISQQTRKELGLQDEINYAQTALTVGISTAVGAIGGGGIGTAPVPTTQQRVSSLIQRRGQPDGAIDKPTADFLAQFRTKEKAAGENRKAIFADSIARREAREVSLDKMDEPGLVTEAVLSEGVVEDIFKVAKQLYTDYPQLRPNLQEVRITQAVADTLSETDPDMLQQAIKRAGVDEKQFFEAFRVTLSQAGATLNEASKLSRFLKGAVAGDPDLEKALQKMSKASEGTEYWSGLEAAATGARVSVAASTAGFSTAVMNAIGLMGSVPLKVAADTIDAVYSTTGRLINDMRGGTVPINAARVREDVSEAFADSTYILVKMADGGYSAELSDLMLKDQPRLSRLISAIGGEAVDMDGMPSKVDKVMNTINVFNRAVDSVVRRPVFVQAVKERMQAIGLDFEDYVANSKPIPVAILRGAVDDANKLTFSYSFKRTSEKSLEGYAEKFAHSVLSLANKNPIGTIVGTTINPFLRFSLNAVRYTYRMTPASALGGAKELMTAKRMLDAGKEAEAAGLVYEGKKKIIDSIVGTAAIAGGIAYRQENADIEPWQYRDDDGNVKDGSGLFPFVNISMLAEAALVIKDLIQVSLASRRGTGTETEEQIDYTAAATEMMSPQTQSGSLLYTLKMSPDERAKEAADIRKRAESLALNAKGRQELLLQAERLELDRVRKFDGKKFFEIMTGLGRQSVDQNTVWDQFARLVEGGITENVERKAGTAVGDFLGRFDNFFNPIYDIANFVMEDNRVVDTRAPTALEQDVGPFADALLGPLMGPIPGLRGQLQEKPSLFQAEPQQVPTAIRQVQGIRPTPPTSRIENELARLRLEPFSVFESTGDRTLDNFTIRLAQAPFQAAVEQLIFRDPIYKSLPINGKRDAIKTRMSLVLNEAKKTAREMYLQTQPEESVQMMYDKMPRGKREAAEDQFQQAVGRRPTTLEDKLRVIQGDFDISGDVGRNPLTEEQMRRLGIGR